MTPTDDRALKIRQAGGPVSSGGWLIGLLTGSGIERFARVFEGRIGRGRLSITTPDGKTRTIDSGKDGPDANIQVTRWRAFRRVLLGGSVGFAKAYIDGDWETPDLATLFEFGATNNKGIGKGLSGAAWIRWLNRFRHSRRANTPLGSRQNIGFHYDLGNRFYKQWLDESMTYSSAVFEDGDTSLEAAQLRKYRNLLDILKVQPGEHILEIGCGWGGFAETAAMERGARVTGITLSEEQLAFSRDRIKKAGLEDRVQIDLRDYRDLDQTFDHVVSIEMFEAVGEKYWPDYFETIYRCLKPGGRAALQIITINESMFPSYRKNVDFIQSYIFPGGMLPSVSTLKDNIDKTGLTWENARSYGQHYARTLAAWQERFEQAWANKALPEEFDEIFHRIWTYYLSYCQGGFRGKSIDVMQLGLSKPKAGFRRTSGSLPEPV